MVATLNWVVEITTYCLFGAACVSSLLPNPREPTLFLVLVTGAIYSVGVAALLVKTFGLVYTPFGGVINTVPIWVGMLYSVALYASISFGSKLSPSGGIVAALSGLSMFFMEPLAVKLGFWSWDHHTEYYGMPITVLFTWTMLGGSYTGCFRFLDYLQENYCQTHKIITQIFLPFVSTGGSMAILFVSWLGYAWVCGITGVLPFVSTYHHPPDMYFVYIIQAFVMAMLIGPLFVLTIFFSRKFKIDNRLTVSDMIVGLLPLAFHLLFTVLIFVHGLHEKFPLLPIATICMLVLEAFFHILPFTEFLYTRVTGEKIPFGESSQPKGVLSSFEDLGMMTDDEVERMLLSGPKRAHGDI